MLSLMMALLLRKLYDLKGWLKQNELYVEGCTPDSLAGFYKEDGRIGDDEFTKDGRVYVDGSRIEVIDNVQYDFRVDEVPELSMLNKGMASAAEDSIDVESSQHHQAAQTFNTARIASDKSSGTYTSTRGIMKLHDITGWLKAATHHFEIVPKNSMNENVAQRANVKSMWWRRARMIVIAIRLAKAAWTTAEHIIVQLAKLHASRSVIEEMATQWMMQHMLLVRNRRL
jgi:hypothetical protein